MPYRLLLPIQIVFIAVLFAIAAGIGSGEGFLAEQHPSFGAFLIGLGAVYAGSMVVRYAVRMRRRPERALVRRCDPDRLPCRARGLSS